MDFIQGKSNASFFHSGDLGDVIACLPVIRQLGGGKLVLGNNHHLPVGVLQPREPMSEAKYRWIAPLLDSLYYIRSTEYLDDYKPVTCDFSTFRVKPILRRMMFCSLSEGHAVHAGLKELNLSKWLHVTPSPKTEGMAVIARSPRYHNRLFRWRDFLDQYPNRIFVGTESELQEFNKELGMRVEMGEFRDALGMAELIAGGKIFLGNQSFPCWLAMALAQPVIQESFPQCPNSQIQRPNARFVGVGRNSPPEKRKFTITFSDIRRPACSTAPYIARAPLLSHNGAIRIFHAVSRREGTDTRRAHAMRSWDVLYDKGVIPCHFWSLTRTARDIQDPRALPYLKDVLQGAMDAAGDNDLIMWTNDDNWLHSDLIDTLIDHAIGYGPASSHRCDFPNNSRLTTQFTPKQLEKIGSAHMGRDLFAFQKKWLVEFWNEIPDFILGASDFDLAMAAIIRRHYGITSTNTNIKQVMHPAEIQKGYVCHVYHPSFWSMKQNIDSAPSQKHNRRLFREWSGRNMPTLIFNENNTLT